MASLPHLVQMDKKYAKKGLRIIGAHVQNSPDEEIKEMVKDKKIKFPVTRGANGPVRSGGIPNMIVFDTSGKIVFNGHPADSESDKAIKRALRGVKESGSGRAGTSSLVSLGASSVLVEERTWTNADGKSLRAALVSMDGDTGTFRRSNGQKFQYDVTKLTEADQKMIEAKKSGDEESEDDEEDEEESA